MTPEEWWAQAWRSLDLAPPDGLLASLSSHLSDPSRHYHDRRHVADCLGWLDQTRHLAEHPGEVALALWFHDAVYDPHQSDNEVRSADWARRALETAGAPPSTVARVEELIMATTHEHSAGSADARLLADIDLAVLGASPEKFAAYEAGIRAEYAWVPEPEFQRARIAILRRFLARPAIYQTVWFRERLEAAARNNLALDLGRLGGAVA
jgi:predicted metal-dependent HD superfamily phosphohydrolase